MDFVIDGVFSVALKVVHELTDEDISVARNHLRGHNMEAGVLINFGAMSLVVKKLERLRS